MSKNNEVKNGAERDCFAYKMGFIASGIVIVSALLDLIVRVITGEGIIGSLLIVLGGMIMLIGFYDSKKKYLKK